VTYIDYLWNQKWSIGICVSPIKQSGPATERDIYEPHRERHWRLRPDFDRAEATMEQGSRRFSLGSIGTSQLSSSHPEPFANTEGRGCYDEA
jgi:hypothetical protein